MIRAITPKPHRERAIRTLWELNPDRHTISQRLIRVRPRSQNYKTGLDWSCSRSPESRACTAEECVRCPRL